MRALGPVAQDRARVARVDDLLDREPLGGAERGAHRVEALLAEITERLNAVRSPFRTAERFGVEEIIDPRDTRPLLCDWAERAHELVAMDAARGPKARGPRP